MFTSPANLLPPVTLLLSFLDDPNFQGNFSGKDKNLIIIKVINN